MTKQETFKPSHFAILSDGIGTPPYPNPRNEGESKEDFAYRIADVVVRGIVDYPYTTFVEIVDAEGVEELELSDLVVEAMSIQRSLKRS